MSDFSRLYNSPNEFLHTCLYAVHGDIYWKALEHIKAALTALHEIEVANGDLRTQCREYIGEFEKLRNELEATGNSAANLRSKLIQEQGCKGTCNPAAYGET